MKSKKELLRQVLDCLEIKYGSSGKRKKSLIEIEKEEAKKRILKGEEYRLDRAQWGGKWGNYRHLIALNSKGNYQYVEGFNPDRFLD